MAEKAKETASYMHTEQLYTVTIEVYCTQEVFIDQVRTAETKLDGILFAWLKQAVARGFIKGTEDPQIPFRDIMERNAHLKPMGGVFNVWEIVFIIGKDFYIKDAILARLNGILDLRETICVTLNFINTATATSSRELAPERAVEASDSNLVRKAEEKYADYLERYKRLKGVPELTKAVMQEQKRAEKQLVYWGAKRRFLRRGYNRDRKSREEYLYTVNFNYEYYRTWGTWTYQNAAIGTDINYVFYVWVRRLLYDTCRPNADSDDREQMITDQDRILLMEKVSLGHYDPAPVAGLTNVWATYFALSEGTVKLTIIKTALKNVVQE
jgi:hypothetical protein